MKVIDCYDPRPLTALARVTARDGATADLTDFEFQVEHCLEVRLVDARQDHPSVRMACTPDHLVELTLGRLFADGVIDGVGDVRTLHLNRPGTVATVTLAERSGTAGVTSQMGASAATGMISQPERLRRPALSGAEALRDIEVVAGRFADDTPMHRRTHGAHSCFIALDGHVVFECEDIGRHNAFDKAVGHALRRGIDLRRAALFTSGRTPFDVIAKTARAGIPVLVSAAVPTDLAVRRAAEAGIALVSRARPGSFLVCSDPCGVLDGALGPANASRTRCVRALGTEIETERHAAHSLQLCS